MAAYSEPPTYGSKPRWNDEVAARYEAKQSLLGEVVDHGGRVRTLEWIPGEDQWSPPEWVCPACQEGFCYTLNTDRVCPAVLHYVNECLDSGCTYAEIRMVCDQAARQVAGGA